MSNVAQILRQIDSGDPSASEHLLPLVYDELRQLASRLLAQESPGQTLQPTALVHEAYVRLTGKQGQEASWANRGHFFMAAAEAMRRLLIEKARRKKRLKHGGEYQIVSFDTAEMVLQAPGDDFLALDEALTRLNDIEPFKAQVVKLRFFAGLTMPEIAQSLNISLATAERYWTYARAWLFAELSEGQEDPSQ